MSKVVWKMLLTNCMEIKHLKAYKAVSSRKSSGRYRPYSNVDSFLKVSLIIVPFFLCGDFKYGQPFNPNENHCKLLDCNVVK